MKISTRGRYGLEALLDLANHASEGHVSLKSISERCDLPEAYILQIFLVLRRAGIIESVRGAQGGYMLGKDSSDITVGEVLRVLEGPLSPVECIIEGTKNPCERYNQCASKIVWKKIMDGLNTVADSITIADLTNKYKAMDEKKEELDFYI